jgi:two-component system NarL family sensor kinase
MVTYVIGLQDWRWALGTGIFIDDIRATVAAARAEVESRVERTFLYIGLIALAALLLVFFSGLFINIRERSMADAALKRLTQRIVDTQEEERGRVARELHDGISQILVSVRYALDLAERRLSMGDARAGDSLRKGIASLTTAIQEVRRISRDLRPGALDDLGLGPALKTLTDEFGSRTGISAELETVVFRNRLDDEAKIALYRIAQEALTNIERHADATEVHIRLFGHQRGATLRIQDNGNGFPYDRAGGGLGLRNMQERVEHLGGTLRILSSDDGTTIEAEVPLTHLLRPDDSHKESA